MAQFVIPLVWLISTMYLIYLDKAYWWVFCVFAVLFAAIAYGGNKEIAKTKNMTPGEFTKFIQSFEDAEKGVEDES